MPRGYTNELNMPLDIDDMRRKAETGNCVAQGMLGVCYLHGHDVEVDYKEAFRFLSAAAEFGASRAVLNLGRMYSQGLGIPQNVPEAIRLFEAVEDPQVAPMRLPRELNLAESSHAESVYPSMQRLLESGIQRRLTWRLTRKILKTYGKRVHTSPKPIIVKGTYDNRTNRENHRTEDFIELENQYGAHNYHPLDVVIERAEGVWVYDVEGKRYLDCLAAYSAVNQGHCHPKILQTLERAGPESHADLARIP